MGAKYLLRFDDICPGMNWPVWDVAEGILRDADIQPLLAVVPDNRDPELNIAHPDPKFWDKVRAWQQLGWSIGLHGFQHQYTSESSGILGRNRYSEFAGLPEHEQTRKLENGLEIFREQGIRPDSWIAPAHSFDETTVRLLAGLGIDCISDGYSFLPFVCERGLVWIPQQLGRFRRMPFGTWTVCLHINSWEPEDLDQFRRSITRFRSSIVSLGELRQRYGRRQRHWSDEIFSTCFRAVRSVRG